MASVRTVIKNAYRKAGITALGQSLTAAQSAVGIELLTETYTDLVSKGTLGRVTDVYTTSDCEAKEFERVFATAPGIVVTFPSSVQDSSTSGYRAPKDGAYITIVGPTRAADIRIYSAETATWEAFNALTLTSSAPLTAAYQSDIEALLAAKLADERGIPVGPILATQIRSARYHLARRDNVASAPARGEYF